MKIFKLAILALTGYLFCTYCIGYGQQTLGYPIEPYPDINKYLGYLYPGVNPGAPYEIGTSNESSSVQNVTAFYSLERQPTAPILINESMLWIVDPAGQYSRRFSLDLNQNESAMMGLTPKATGTLRMYVASPEGSQAYYDIGRVNAGYTYTLWFRVGNLGENEVWYSVSGLQSNHIWLNAFTGLAPIKYN